MKKYLYIILLVVSSTNIFAQEWRDSLEVARSAYKAKNYDKALKYYQSAQKKAPEGVDFSDEMGQSAYKSREFKTAEKLYEQSTSKNADKARKSKTYHNIGNSRMEQKNYQGAVDAYKEALRNNPSDEKTRYNLSEAMRRLKEEQDKKDKKDQKNDESCNKNNPSSNQGDKQNQSPQNSKNNKGKGDQPEDNKSSLPNKTADRLLDKLMKEESETKRRVSGNKGEKGEATSGKDW